MVNRAPTTKKEQDEAFRPEALRARTINTQEQKGTVNSQSRSQGTSGSVTGLLRGEQTPDATWKTNVRSGLEAAAKSSVGVKGKKAIRTKIIVSTIALALGAGGLSISGFLTTALINIKELVNNKVDTLSSIIDDRQGILLKDKLFNTSTTCVIKIKCRYVGITQFMMDRLTIEGAKLVDEKGDPAKKNILGKYSGTTLVLKGGETVTAATYDLKRLTSKELRGLSKIVLKPRVLAWNDATAKKIREAKRIGQNPDLGTDEKSRRVSIYNQVSGGAQVLTSINEPESLGDSVDEAGNPIAPTDAGTAGEDIVADAGELTEQALSGIEVTPLSDDIGEVINKEPYVGRFSAGKLFQGLANLANPAGPISDVCTTYQLVDATVKLSRVTVLLQAMRYSAMFMAMADKMKAGEITDTELESVMNILNTPDAVGDTFGDSFSWQQITGTSDKVPSKPLTVSAAGNSIIQTMSSALKTVRDLFGGQGNVKKLCFIADALTLTAFIPFIGPAARAVTGAAAAGSAVLKGSTSVFFKELWQTAVSSVTSKLGTAAARKESAEALRRSLIGVAKSPSTAVYLATYLAERYAISYAAQQIAGTSFGADTDGVKALDAIKTGLDAQIAESKRVTGFKPTTSIAAATGALTKNNAYTNEYIAFEKENADPFDTNNPYSFVSTISTISLPFTSKLTSMNTNPSSILSLPASLLSSATSGLFGQSVSAATSTEDDIKAELSYCEDDTVLENIVKLPNCIPLYIPPEGLNNNGAAVAEQMVSAELLSSSGRPKGDYATRMGTCMDPELSILDQTVIENCYSTDYIESTQSDLIGVYTIDQRLLDGIDGEQWVIADEYVSPLDSGYKVNDEFGPRDCSNGVASCWHKGIDLGAGPFAPVYAVASGTVVASGKGGIGGAGVRCSGGETSGGNNNTTSIRLEDGAVVSYLHMGGADIPVSVGDTVNAGDLIGKINNCGQSTGAHLHFEVKITGITDPAILALPKNPSGQYVNPRQYLELYGVSL